MSCVSQLEVVKKYRKENPQGKKCDCARSTHLSRPTIDKYWIVCNEGQNRLKPEDLVQQWRLSHPDGKKIECIKDTKLAKMTVYKYWNVKITIKKEKKSQQFYFDF